VKTLLEREELASTGVGQNVAIPHVKLEGLDEAVASLSVHNEGVEWAAVDGEPVQVLFTVLRPEHAGESHDPDRHLEMMRWVASLSRNGDFRNFAIQARTRTELVDLLKEMS
jgi:mannitol/fructose-specific phosphotransferase system IIA component (Ntr-type)